MKSRKMHGSDISTEKVKIKGKECETGPSQLEAFA